METYLVATPSHAYDVLADVFGVHSLTHGVVLADLASTLWQAADYRPFSLIIDWAHGSPCLRVKRTDRRVLEIVPELVGTKHAAWFDVTYQ